MNKKKPLIIVTIPAYNEAKTIGAVIKDIIKEMRANNYNFRVLVVDDGSSDATASIAKKSGAIVYSHPRNYGLAETFKTEMKICIFMKADIIVHTDADGQYLAKEIPLLVEKVIEGYDLVLGSRFAGKIEEMPLIKRIGNKLFSKVISQITNMKITDGQTGFRAFTSDVAKNVNISSNYTYTQEQIIRAARLKYKICEVPIFFAKRGGNTKSRLMKNPFHYAFRAWTTILRIYRDYEPLKFFGYVGFALFLPGFLIGLWVLFTFILTGTVGALPRVILSMLLILVGVQIILFGFLADMNRK